MIYKYLLRLVHEAVPSVTEIVVEDRTRVIERICTVNVENRTAAVVVALPGGSNQRRREFPGSNYRRVTRLWSQIGRIYPWKSDFR